MNRTNLQRPIEFMFGLIGLAVAWQAVRFCQGLAPIPMLDKPPADYSLTWIIQTPFYYLIGIMLWLSAALLVMFAGKAVARVVAVGFDQFAMEFKSSWDEEQRLAKLEANRRKRREMRQKLRQEKSGDNATIGFIIGAIVGGFFF